MSTGKTNTLHSHPSLFALQAALTAAESVTPACPARLDVHEQRAAQLIQKIQAGYKKPSPFLDLRDIPSPDVRRARLGLHELAGPHAG
jgi:hypothetical protein